MLIQQALKKASGNIIYPGLIAAWSAKDKSNDDEDRATLKDLTGNGHDITLNGFAFNTEGSGYGHPEYSDALVFDGVDDCGINKTVPKIDDFTLILKATVLNKSGTNAIISKDINAPGAFSLRWDKVLIYNLVNNLPFTDGINYLTPNTYNGTNVNKGPAPDQLGINIGCIRSGNYLCNMAFYSAYLFDRSLDEQEIKAFIRKYIDPEYLLPSEIPTPDCYYDFSQGSNDDENRDTIKDLSGNGNDAVAHNFAWNESGSGYKDGALVFDF